ncbi:MAG: septum formation protein [Candidatus Azotimanducaceae bacterium]
MADYPAKQLVLSSSSPRRADLLKQIGLEFSISHPQVDETPMQNEAPDAYVERLALSKSKAGWAEGFVSLGADTIVVHDGKLLGKPDSAAEGIWMLRCLSEQTHQVMTGVALYDGLHFESVVVTSDVSFRAISLEEAQAYWRSGEAKDKAGGYGIQGLGAVFCEKIAGSYTAIVGLPVFETEVLLQSFGIDTWAMRANV